MRSIRERQLNWARNHLGTYTTHNGCGRVEYKFLLVLYKDCAQFRLSCGHLIYPSYPKFREEQEAGIMGTGEGKEIAIAEVRYGIPFSGQEKTNVCRITFYEDRTYDISKVAEFVEFDEALTYVIAKNDNIEDEMSREETTDIDRKRP